MLRLSRNWIYSAHEYSHIYVYENKGWKSNKWNLTIDFRSLLKSKERSEKYLICRLKTSDINFQK